MLNVLGISITFIPSVMLCGHCQLDYLAKKGIINYKFVPEHFLDNKIVEWADVLVFIRSDSDLEAYVSKIARKAGKRLIYVMDDDLANVPSYASSYYYYSLPSTHKNRKIVMSNCDMFLTPSPVLMEKYGGPFKYKYLIKEPSLNRITEKPKNDMVKIGFAGSIDRAKDIGDILEETIRKLIDKYQDSISIEFMGAHPSFIDELNIKYLPYQDGYDAYTAYMAKCNWDIGLAPMPVSDFHECKYYNKFVEYASFGIVGVYSNVKPYIFGIENGVNGLLVENNTEDWFNAICKLIDDNKFREKLSAECIRQANEIYNLDILAYDYLDKITRDYAPIRGIKFNSFNLVKKTFTLKRIYRKIVEKKWKFPKWLIEKLEHRKKLQKERDELVKNTAKLKDRIKNNDTVFIISPYVLDYPDNSYVSRVKEIDALLKDYNVVYIDGEDKAFDSVRTVFINDRTATIKFNSFVKTQCDEVISMLECGKACLIHNVERFIPEKLGIDFYALLDDKKILKIWDVHDNFPEKYHEAMNFHTEMVVEKIEKDFVDRVDLIISGKKEVLNNIQNKYKITNNCYLINKENDNILKELIRRQYEQYTK